MKGKFGVGKKRREGVKKKKRKGEGRRENNVVHIVAGPYTSLGGKCMLREP